MIADRRLYLTRDGRLVPEGDPAAWTLFAATGASISFQDARRYGLAPVVEAPLVETAALPAPPETEALHTPPLTKAVVLNGRKRGR